MGDDAITDTVAGFFERCGVTVPADDVWRRVAGRVVGRGWWIAYRFGVGERGAFVEWYETHRMTNDRHVRRWADGTNEDLAAMPVGFVGSNDPDEHARREAAYRDGVRAVLEMLRQTGFDDTANPGEPTSIDGYVRAPVVTDGTPDTDDEPDATQTDWAELARIGEAFVHQEPRWRLATKTAPAWTMWQPDPATWKEHGSKAGRWPVDLMEKAAVGDEIWWYSNREECWDHLCGRAGWALVRDGAVIDTTLEIMN